MKTPEEIKKLAKEYAKIKYGAGYYPDVENAFINGYVDSTIHNTDNKFTLQDMEKAYHRMETKFKSEPFENFIQSLNTNNNKKENIISLVERKDFTCDIAVRVNGLEIAKLRARGNGWYLESLDVIHSFWIGGTIKQFATLDEAKEGAIKWAKNWLNN